jgi:hypothetical protein
VLAIKLVHICTVSHKSDLNLDVILVKFMLSVDVLVSYHHVYFFFSEKKWFKLCQVYTSEGCLAYFSLVPVDTLERDVINISK